MMRLSSLQSERIHATAFEVDWAAGSDEIALDLATRPEAMEHRTPRLLGVSAVIRGSVLANHEARCVLGDLDVDNVLRAP